MKELCPKCMKEAAFINKDMVQICEYCDNFIVACSQCNTMECNKCKYSNTITVDIPKGYRLDKLENDKMLFVIDNPPQTYIECLNYLNPKYKISDNNVLGYGCKDLGILQQLIICRNAWYDYYNCKLNKVYNYAITFYSPSVFSITETTENRVLIFPTKKMAEDFYEVFKKDVEKCKFLI